MIKIVSDTNASLPREITVEYDLAILSHYVTLDGRTYQVGVDLHPQQFYDFLSTSDQLPVTGPVTVDDFYAVYNRLLDEDPAVTIISIHLSRELSETCDNAVWAAQALRPADIRVFDSRFISFGYGLMVIEAAEMARNGFTASDILDRLDEMRRGMRSYTLLSTLDYLAKGGRIGRAQQWVGTLLDMKPILALEDGVVAPHSTQRTWNRSLDVLVELVVDGCSGSDGRTPLPGIQIGVSHANNELEACHIAETLRTELNPDRLIVGPLGAGLVPHMGPGAVSLAWYAPGS
ncbi:MAG: DegV family protein [Anaerolineae bacterium]|nr:DegV family protein [Anaerolineae bacterium]